MTGTRVKNLVKSSKGLLCAGAASGVITILHMLMPKPSPIDACRFGRALQIKDSDPHALDLMRTLVIVSHILCCLGLLICSISEHESAKELSSRRQINVDRTPGIACFFVLIPMLGMLIYDIIFITNVRSFETCFLYSPSNIYFTIWGLFPMLTISIGGGLFLCVSLTDVIREKIPDEEASNF